MKKLIALLLALCMILCMVACSENAKEKVELSETQKIIQQAQTMTLEELAGKAQVKGHCAGIGGYSYCHYLFVTDNSPLPWVSTSIWAPRPPRRS